ncbi:MAG: hypothetical protein JXJ04_21630, partial [Spirochaetales bacterium]|nr:hypothetical protein [Spirochaetales bacterium]
MRNMKIILGILPLWGTDHPPLGIGYLTAQLEKYNYKVIQSDFNIDLRTLINKQNSHIFNKNSKFWGTINGFNKFIYPIIDSNLNNYVDSLLDM